jgi:hypothetical protein
MDEQEIILTFISLMLCDYQQMLTEYSVNISCVYLSHIQVKVIENNRINIVYHYYPTNLQNKAKILVIA